MSTFEALALPPKLVAVLKELGYEQPTPIQAQSIPALLAGKDLLGQSHTGSGKTAAFALPLLANLHMQGRVLQAVILCPTRELCAQVAREIRKLGRRCDGLQVLVLAGGVPSRPQTEALRKGVHMVVGTPGRVLDHLRRTTLDLSHLRSLVLDEADRMLDMGFEEDMKQILKSAPAQRQTMLFSATFPPSLDAICSNYLQSPVRVTVDTATHDAPEIEQIVYEIGRDDKIDTLTRILTDIRPKSALVFCNLKVRANEIAEALAQRGVRSAALHGDLDQNERDMAMTKFRNRSVQVLVATDVAARGLDVEALDLVVNLDLPIKPEVYVHRIGRSGRAGRSGVAISLMLPREKSKIAAIEEFAGVKLQRRSTAALPSTGDNRTLAASGGAAMVTIAINGGRKDKLRPGDILGALTGEAGGLDGSQIGKIEIQDRVAYVALAQDIARTALKCLQEGRIKGRKFSVSLIT